MHFRNVFKIILSKRYYRGKIRHIVIQKPILLSRGINFGDRIFVRDGGRIELVKDFSDSKFTPNLIIKDNVNIEQNCHITCGEELIIGKNTAILPNVCITDIDHLYEDLNIPPKSQLYKTSRVKIGNDCMIGINSVILAGTVLGNHCVVGANSVVRGQFPNNCILAGSPAKIIRKYNFEKKEWIKV